MLREWLAGRLGADTPRYDLLVDGPNILREPFDVDLREVSQVVRERGHVRLARVFLDHRASAGLIQASEAAGFQVRTTSGDVDVALAVAATSAIERGGIDGLAIASRDIDFKPVLELARERGLRTLIIAPGETGRSTGLAAVAHEAVVISE